MSLLQPKWHVEFLSHGMKQPIALDIDAMNERDAQGQALARLHDLGLSRMVDTWEALAAISEVAEITRANGTGLPLIDVAAWVGEPPERRSLWGDWLPLRQTTMLTGMGGVGKSLFEQCLFTAIAVGKPFLGMPVEQRNCLYITCEDDQDELFRRQAAIERSLGIERADWLGRLHLVSLADQPGTTALATAGDDRRLVPTDRWREIEDTCRHYSIGLFAFDSATDALAGDMNDNALVAQFIQMLTGLAMAQDGAAMLLHHPNKSDDQWSGAMAFHNKVRSRWFMEFGNPEADPDARSLINPKSNYGPAGGRIDFRWHEGAFVRAEDLPNAEGKALVCDMKERGAQAAFLACLRAREPGREVGPHRGPNYAPTSFAGMAQAKGYSKERLAAAMEQLFASGAIRTEQVKRRGNDTKTIIVEASA
jgi:RecA-family ATPase